MLDLPQHISRRLVIYIVSFYIYTSFYIYRVNPAMTRRLLLHSPSHHSALPKMLLTSLIASLLGAAGVAGLGGTAL